MIPVAADPRPHLIAHRGGADEAPENSFLAFQQAYDAGVRYLETDAQVTADGVVVLSHDETVDRCFDGTGVIKDLTWGQIAELRNQVGERMPRLDEVLEMFPDYQINIDAKTDEVVDPLLDTLGQQDAFGRTLVASFSEKRLQRVREMDAPGLSTSLGVNAVVRLMLASETVSSADTWRVGGPHQSVRAVQVPEKMRGIRVVNPRFVATAHGAGLAVHVWTVNEPAAMVRLLDWGVDGIVTDRPTMLREVLRVRGQWAEPPHLS